MGIRSPYRDRVKELQSPDQSGSGPGQSRGRFRVGGDSCRWRIGRGEEVGLDVAVVKTSSEGSPGTKVITADLRQKVCRDPSYKMFM